jgi:hypothetical protein
MRTWTECYKSDKDVNHVFLTLVHVCNEHVHWYTEHVLDQYMLSVHMYTQGVFRCVPLFSLSRSPTTPDLL